MEKYNTLGMKETCLNCGKKTCNLAGKGNVARINENNGCWIPQPPRVYIRQDLSGLYYWLLGVCSASIIWFLGWVMLE